VYLGLHFAFNDILIAYQFFFLINFSPRLPAGSIELCTNLFSPKLERSSMTSEEYKEAVLQSKEHILAGDIFQIVLSQRFERRTFADPFEVYRALRIVNPSPYMTYLQVFWLFLSHFARKVYAKIENLTFSSICSA
jgi:hypothetical protein